MKKLYQNAKWASIWLTVKPWLTVIAFFVILRYTGVFSGVSQVTQSALMKMGFLNAVPNTPAVIKNFNYNFTMKDLHGKTVNGSDFKNKTLFINLWATWCGPCRSEMSSIHSLYQKVNHDKVAFIMLSIDDPNHDQKVSKYISDNNYTFPVYRPIDGLPYQLQVTTIPTTFIVSPEGKIVSKKVGAASYDNEEFLQYLENLK
jgi:thiol-disulfide isomerase/thioredoxin